MANSQAYKEVTSGQIVVPDDEHVAWFEAWARWERTDEKPKTTRSRSTKSKDDGDGDKSTKTESKDDAKTESK